MKRTKSPTRLSRTDWLSLGLQHLAKAGPEGLTIEKLTALAGKTKGSFYHHFEDQPAFIKALLDYWRETHTERIIQSADEAATPEARKRVLSALVASLDLEIESAIRRLAAVTPIARQIVTKVDQRRITYMTELNATRRNLSAEEARAISEVEYASFVGAQLVFGKKCKSWLATIGDRVELRPRT